MGVNNSQASHVFYLTHSIFSPIDFVFAAISFSRITFFSSMGISKTISIILSIKNYWVFRNWNSLYNLNHVSNCNKRIMDSSYLSCGISNESFSSRLGELIGKSSVTISMSFDFFHVSLNNVKRI